MRSIEERFAELEKQISDNSANLKGIEYYLEKSHHVKFTDDEFYHVGEMASCKTTTGGTKTLEFLRGEYDRAQSQLRSNKAMFEESMQEYNYSLERVNALYEAIAALK
jgi:hypothetical protein